MVSQNVNAKTIIIISCCRLPITKQAMLDTQLKIYHDTLSETAFVAQLVERCTRFAGLWVQFSPKALELHFSQLVSGESYCLPSLVIECIMPILIWKYKRLVYSKYDMNARSNILSKGPLSAFCQLHTSSSLQLTNHHRFVSSILHMHLIQLYTIHITVYHNSWNLTNVTFLITGNKTGQYSLTCILAHS